MVTDWLANLERKERGRDSRENAELAAPRFLNISEIPQPIKHGLASLSDKGLTKETLGEGMTWQVDTQPLIKEMTETAYREASGGQAMKASLREGMRSGAQA